MYLQQQYTTIGVRVANALFYYGGVLKNICAVVFCFLFFIFFIFGGDIIVPCGSSSARLLSWC
jgi:hypothetical protein